MCTASPKSQNLWTRSSPTRMFSVLKSRWVMWASCILLAPFSSCNMAARTADLGQRPEEVGGIEAGANSKAAKAAGRVRQRGVAPLGDG
jgi:hypothetical protein